AASMALRNTPSRERSCASSSKSRASHSRPSRLAGTSLSGAASMPLTLPPPVSPANGIPSATQSCWQRRPRCRHTTSAVLITCELYPCLASHVIMIVGFVAESRQSQTDAPPHRSLVPPDLLRRVGSRPGSAGELCEECTARVLEKVQVGCLSCS